MIRIIQIDGSTTDKYFIHQPPYNDQLREWIGCEFIEIVRVFYDGKYERLIVDETSALKKDKVVNQAATNIYHENARVHAPYMLIDAPPVYGVAVLLTGEHKLT